MASLPPLALKTRDKPLHRQLSMAPSRMDIVPEKIVMFTDAGTDLDDEMAMIFARYLIEFNFIDLLGVVSVLHPSFKRAQLARGTMDMIGLHAVPVAFGTDGGDVAGRNEAPDAASFSYMPPDGSERSFSLETGRTLLYRILVAAEPKSVGVVVGAAKKFPPSKAPISAASHSFRLIFGRAIISWSGLDAWMLFLERARAEHSR